VGPFGLVCSPSSRIVAQSRPPPAREKFSLTWQALLHRHILCRPKSTLTKLEPSCPPRSRIPAPPISAPLLPLTILVPVFNDWAAAELLVQRIDSVFGEHALSGHLLFIDDGSLESLPEQFPKTPPRNLQKIQSVELRTNLGHERALCVSGWFTWRKASWPVQS
jgi:hypothetical protein